MRGVSPHAPSPLQDETLVEVAEAAQAANKGGTAGNRPLPMNIGRGLFLCTRASKGNMSAN